MAAKNANPAPTGLVVIARAASGQIVTRIPSHRDLVGALHTARCVLTDPRMMQCESRCIIQSIPPRTTRVGP